MQITSQVLDGRILIKQSFYGTKFATSKNNGLTKGRSWTVPIDSNKRFLSYQRKARYQLCSWLRKQI